MTTRSVPLFPVAKRFGQGDLVGGRYRLVRQIGAGAMGTVWVAHNELLDVDVAVKVLRVDNQKADATRLYKRLLREAQAAARLGHPGIVRVFDFGQTEDKSPYIVMELLAGESLAELLSRQPKMELVPAVQLMLPVIDAMATAHGRGIIHRDVKPENIFLARDEYGRLTPKIVDFGVARFAEAGRSLTRSGALLGTPDYMAPEQARGEPNIDQRVDVWALCIVLYELVTGRRPFARDATNYLAVLRAIVHEPAPSILNFGVGDAGLWRILERGLKKRKTDRWETMRSLGEALALWLYERGVREDAVGASLKATWLQAGLDGVKIDTPSMLPPKPLDSDRPSGPESDPDPAAEAPEPGAQAAPPAEAPAREEAPAPADSGRPPAPLTLKDAPEGGSVHATSRFSVVAISVAVAALALATLVVVLRHEAAPAARTPGSAGSAAGLEMPRAPAAITPPALLLPANPVVDPPAMPETRVAVPPAPEQAVAARPPSPAERPAPGATSAPGPTRAEPLPQPGSSGGRASPALAATASPAAMPSVSPPPQGPQRFRATQRSGKRSSALPSAKTYDFGF